MGSHEELVDAFKDTLSLECLYEDPAILRSQVEVLFKGRVGGPTNTFPVERRAELHIPEGVFRFVEEVRKG